MFYYDIAFCSLGIPRKRLNRGVIEQLQNREKFIRLSQEKVVYLGRLAIRAEQLGINDPLTHLYQYLEKGEKAVIGICQDVETDIAERLPKTPFINYVNFEFNCNDFVSAKDKVSMNLMTQNNLKIISEEYHKNPKLMAQEYERAKIESHEVSRLISWFKQAPTGACQIFESLPIGNQTIAISRIYRKTGLNQLEGCFVSLYSPNIELFNHFRQTINPDVKSCRNELEILDNNYSFYNPNLLNGQDFIDYYVGVYDNLLRQKTGQIHNFGIISDKKQQIKNGVQLVRSQPSLINVYLDTIKKLSVSQGLATDEIIDINQKIKTRHKLKRLQPISTQIAHDILSSMIIGITSAIDQGSSTLLKELEQPYSTSDTNLATISHFAEVASSSNQSYESGACPEYSRSAENNSNSQQENETTVINQAFGIKSEKLKNFGTPKIDVCRIANCPSRGNLWWWPDKTLVGGCSICVHCHKLLQKGENPEKYHKQQKDKEAKKEKITA